MSDKYFLAFQKAYLGSWKRRRSGPRRVAVESEHPVVDSSGYAVQPERFMQALKNAAGYYPTYMYGTVSSLYDQENKVQLLPEAGPILELNTAVHMGIENMCRSLECALQKASEILKQKEMYILGYGCHPRRLPKQITFLKTPRYQILQEIFGQPLRRFLRVASLQLQADIYDGEIVDVVNTNGIAGLIIVLSANGLVFNDKMRNPKTPRIWAYKGFSGHERRTGIPPLFSTTHYLKYLYELPYLFRPTNDNNLAFPFVKYNHSFGKFLREFEITDPNIILEHIQYLETTLYHFGVRARVRYQTGEFRSPCQQRTPNERKAILALLLGIAENSKKVSAFVQRYSGEFWSKFLLCSPYMNVFTTFENTSVQFLLRELVTLAQEGLEQRDAQFGLNESELLTPLFDIVDGRAKTPHLQALNMLNSGIEEFVKEYRVSGNQNT